MAIDGLPGLTELALQAHGAAPLAVAYSGGGDSTALLHVLAQSPRARRLGLRAIHVDHGLHADSAHWVEHCHHLCTALQVPLEIRPVQVDDPRGIGLEAAARHARYAAFAASLGDGEALLLAHHRDDQVETVLLKLLRGAGPAGLGGMREEREFAAGTLWRPWLEVSRTSIVTYLESRQLAYLDDPANAEPRHARNFVRHQLLPCLVARWPQAAAPILHSAALCRDAARYLQDEAERALVWLVVDERLDAAGWLALDDALRTLALETWLHRRGLAAPDTAQRRELERQVRHSAADRVPCIEWPGVQLRLWRGGLYAMRPLPPLPPAWQARWRGETLALPLGRLEAPASGAVPLQATVRLPGPGLRLRPAGDAHTRELSELLRLNGTPPWLRPYWPLLYHGDDLVAVPGLCVCASARDRIADMDSVPVWRRD